MVAPVPAVRLDEVAGQDLAGVEGDDRDLVLVDDGQDPLTGMSRADVEVVQAAGPAQGDRALPVGHVGEIIAAKCDSAIDPDLRFLRAHHTDPLPLEAESFDLLVSLLAGPVSRYCTGYLRVGGVLLANPSHGDVALASIDPRYELAGVIRSRDGGYRYASGELESYLVPKTPVEDIAELVERTGRGIAYTRSAYAYLFRRVR